MSLKTIPTRSGPFELYGNIEIWRNLEPTVGSEQRPSHVQIKALYRTEWKFTA